MAEATHPHPADAVDTWVRMVGLLQLVALGPEEQARLLVPDDRGPDHRATDIANAVDDARAIGQKLHALGRLTWEQYAPIARLRAYTDGLNDEPGESDVWSDEAVAVDSRWEEARMLAREALAAVAQAYMD